MCCLLAGFLLKHLMKLLFAGPPDWSKSKLVDADTGLFFFTMEYAPSVVAASMSIVDAYANSVTNIENGTLQLLADAELNGAAFGLTFPLESSFTRINFSVGHAVLFDVNVSVVINGSLLEHSSSRSFAVVPDIVFAGIDSVRLSSGNITVGEWLNFTVAFADAFENPYNEIANYIYNTSFALIRNGRLFTTILVDVNGTATMEKVYTATGTYNIVQLEHGVPVETFASFIVSPGKFTRDSSKDRSRCAVANLALCSDIGAINGSWVQSLFTSETKAGDILTIDGFTTDIFGNFLPLRWFDIHVYGPFENGSFVDHINIQDEAPTVLTLEALTDYHRAAFELGGVGYYFLEAYADDELVQIHFLGNSSNCSVFSVSPGKMLILIT